MSHRQLLHEYGTIITGPISQVRKLRFKEVRSSAHDCSKLVVEEGENPGGVRQVTVLCPGQAASLLELPSCVAHCETRGKEALRS